MKIRPISTIIPEVEESAVITDNSTVVGDVKVGGNTIVWYSSVLRGDDAPIRYECPKCAELAIMCRSVSKCVSPTQFACPKASQPRLSSVQSAWQGHNTTIGPGCILKSNIIDNDCIIGENCILLEGSRMERGASLGNNSTLLQGVVIPSGQHWEGNPAAYVGQVDSDPAKRLRLVADWLLGTKNSSISTEPSKPTQFDKLTLFTRNVLFFRSLISCHRFRMLLACCTNVLSGCLWRR